MSVADLKFYCDFDGGTEEQFTDDIVQKLGELFENACGTARAAGGADR